MAAPIHTLKGPAKIKGIQSNTTGAATLVANNGTSDITYTVASSVNIDSLTWEPRSQIDKMASTAGDIVESMIASKRERGLTLTLVPMGANSTDTAGAYTVAQNLINIRPLTKVVLSNFGMAALNSNFNYIEGGSISLTREGLMIVSGIKLEQYETSTANTFDALT